MKELMRNPYVSVNSANSKGPIKIIPRNIMDRQLKHLQCFPLKSQLVHCARSISTCRESPKNDQQNSGNYRPKGFTNYTLLAEDHKFIKEHLCVGAWASLAMPSQILSLIHI